MEEYSGLMVLITLLIIVYAVVTFLLPFFVLRIRNEMISMNKKMSQLINIMRDEREVKESEDKAQVLEEKFAEGEMVAICPHCNTKNSPDDLNCLKCGKPLF